MELGSSAWKREKWGRQRGLEKATGGLTLQTEHELCSSHSSWSTRYVQQDPPSIPHRRGQLCCEVPAVSVLVISSLVRQDFCNTFFATPTVKPQELCSSEGLPRSPVNCFVPQKNCPVKGWGRSEQPLR